MLQGRPFSSIPPVVLLVQIVALFSCNEERLTRRQPDLVVSVHTAGTDYADYQLDPVAIDLGEVPLYSSAQAVFELHNVSTEVLTVEEVVFTGIVGGKWVDPPAFPTVLDAGEKGLLRIEYAPDAQGAHEVTAQVNSDAASGPQTAKVVAQGVYLGAPDIEIDYENTDYVGPLSEDCNAASGVCAVPESEALSFGTVAIGGTGTVRFSIRNAAACDPFPGAQPCTSCALTIAKDGGHHNIGLGFKADTNDEGRFHFAGSTATPFDILQKDASCGETGGVKFALEFDAPEEQGDHRAVVVVESNDPDEPVVEIPVVALVRNAPVAVVDLRDYDVVNPSAPWSDPDDLRVLGRVHLDGRQSYDPADPNDPTLIDTYEFSVVEYPYGASPADFDEQNDGNGFFSFWAPMVGNYTVALRVHSGASDAWSGETERSKLSFFVGSASRLHVELAWDHPTNDQDLHLTHANVDDRLCAPNDCYFANCNPADSSPPIWFTEDPAHQGANPSLDIDDTMGLGPENINIDEPRPGTYRIYVHYYGGDGATRNTVKVYLDDILVAEYHRTLSTHDVWAVADIIWYANGTGEVASYPSDATGESGAIGVYELIGCWSEYVF